MTHRPIPAVGLASAILQIIDFSIKLLRKDNHIYQPSDPQSTPSVENAQVLQSIINNLFRLTDAVDNSELKKLHDGSKGKLSEPAQHLLKISEETKELTTPLIDALIATQAKGSFGDPRWGTAREALCNSVWKERDVTGLKKKLRAVRKDVDVALLLALRYVCSSRQHVSRRRGVDQLTDNISTSPPKRDSPCSVKTARVCHIGRSGRTRRWMLCMLMSGNRRARRMLKSSQNR
jgi:hypothetical protein